jgi:hypothetical protein
MAESVLQSFVIRLTYAVDEVSSRKFQQGIQQGIQGLNGVRIAALAAVVGIEEMVRRTTNAYAPLDYLAKSSGTSAAAIDHLSALFIGANMSAQQAQATIGQLGQEFRTLPGHMQNAVHLVGEFGGDITVFMEKARDKLGELLKQAGGNWSAAPVQGFLAELESATNASTKIQVEQLQIQQAASVDYANKTKKSWEALKTTPEEAAAASAKANRELELLGKTLQIAFLELLTKKDDKGHSLLEVIVSVAQAFQQWLVSPEAQKQFKEIFDSLMTNMPLIEKALDHLGPIVEAFLLIWVGSKALAMLGFFGQWRVSVLGVLGPLTALAAAVLFLPDKFLTPAQQKERREKFDDVRKWINRLVTGAKEGEEKLPPLAPSGQPTPQPLGPPRKHTVGDPLNGLGGIWQKLKEDFGKVGPGSRPHAQQGGIVPINAHAGEMVLPTAISSGLQSFFSGGSGGLFDTSRRLLDQFVSWFAGDSSYKPQVELGDDTLDRMGHGRPAQEAPGPGGPGGGPGGTTGPGGEGYRADTGNTAQTGKGHAVSKAERLAYYKEQADKLGLNYAAIVATVANEGLNDYVGDNGKSFGDFQLYTGGGMGNEAEKAGIKIRDPQTWKAQADYVFKQMLAHKGDAGWYGGQWHGPRNWAPWALHHFSDPNAVPPSGYATTPPPLPGAAPAPGASTGFGPIEVAIGDSIAKGIDDALGLHAGAGTFADAVGGTTPKQIFERLHGHIKDYAGRSISLASGSNPNAGYDQSQMDAVKKTVKDLHDVGANVVLLGVGAGVKDAAKINAQLGSIAKEFHYGFTGELPTTQRNHGVVHPTDEGYRQTIEQIKRAGQQVSSATWGADAASRIWGNKQQPQVVVKNDTHVHVNGGDGRSATSKQADAIYSTQTRIGTRNMAPVVT